MRGLAVAVGCLAVGLVALQRLTWLAPNRGGWLFYLANVVGELGPKRLGLGRSTADASLALVGVALLAIGGVPGAVLVVAALTLMGLELALLRQERRLLSAAWAREDRLGPEPVDARRLGGLANGYPSPSTHPELTVSLLGPFVRRQPRFDLGTLVLGRRLALDVVIGNHAMTPTQTGIRLELKLPRCLRLDGEAERQLPPLAPGQVHRVPVALEASSAASRTWFDLLVQWGDAAWTCRVQVERIVPEAKVRAAAIRRYPGACRSAFVWRGDMDLYDTSTFQTLQGLEATFSLAARYRVPQTMYLSTRLSLDEAEARAWADHYRVDRGAGEIPAFIAWMRSKVDLQHRAAYPFDSTKPYLVELGNHGHLHFGTDTAAAAENGWRRRARIGAGRYPWLGAEMGSFAEQRDNALEARRWCEDLFGFTPRSWAMPDRTRDEHTPAAMEAAGCEVLSDSDARTRDNVIRQSPPHFAPGSGAVELTKRYPGDPQHLLHYWMNLFWVHRAHRLGIPAVFMCHQHMRLFDGWACTRLTEGILRHVLQSFSGDLWITTVYGLGVYWRDVLSERRTVSISVDDGSVTVRSSALLVHCSVPVDLELEGGGRATMLVDVAPGSQVQLDARGVQ